VVPDIEVLAPEGEVRHLLSGAQTHLRQKLVASGCTLKASRRALR
jgi:hypothetical protein